MVDWINSFSNELEISCNEDGVGASSVVPLEMKVVGNYSEGVVPMEESSSVALVVVDSLSAPSVRNLALSQ